MRLHLAVLAASLSLAACATPTDTGGYHLQAERAMLTAEGAFNVAAKAELNAKAAGFLTGAKAAKADELRHQGYTALKVARTAYNNGNVPDTTALLSVTAQITAMIPAKQ